MLKEYLVVDLETTGLNPVEDRIIEIGAVKVRDGKVEDIFESFVNPKIKIPQRITEVTGINDAMVKDAKDISAVIGEFISFAKDLPLIGHNLMFDFSFLKANAVNNNLEFERVGIDTLKLARENLSTLESKRLDYLCAYFNISDENHHRAVNDAMATRELYEILCEKFEKENGEFEPKELLFKVKKQSPITPKQVKYLQDLIRHHGLSVDYEIGGLTKSQASRIIDNIILEYGKIF